MPFPKTRDEMVAAGYKFSNHARCIGREVVPGCGAEIEWWETPRGKTFVLTETQAAELEEALKLAMQEFETTNRNEALFGLAISYKASLLVTDARS